MSHALPAPAASEQAPLAGPMLWVAALMLAAANFIAVLNMTIANVAVPNIAGALGAATSQGTWVITSYAVGEAITVPLTGWLAARFGAVRVFVGSMILFGAFSIVCGLSTSLGVLVVARVFQGLCGGPLMPLSQTLLLRIFPKSKAAAAIGLWSMTTLVAPVVGPILGGWLCDEYSWSWVFLINAPIAIGFGLYAWSLLKRYQAIGQRSPIDLVGLGLLIVWVAALQLVLDEGKNLDWFASTQIVVLAVVAAIGFAVFLVWELHEPHPIVDLRVFRHRGFTVAVLTISLAFAAFFGVSVLTPLWLQSFMGYTATDAGFATAWTGVTAFFLAPLVASSKRDPRQLVFAGVVWMGLVTLWRTFANTDMGFWDVAVPLMVMGLAMPFFFIPSTTLALASVTEREMDSAAGLMNFLRTLSGAFATSLVTTVWSNRITYNHAELVGLADRDHGVTAQLVAQGTPPDTANQIVDYLLTSQSVMLSTNQVMTSIGVLFLFAALIIWFAPRPTRSVEPGAGGH
ncbi:MAG: DHA2 family efflux MFS transporter permease subunit [Candidatus Dactylopiibacterium sp.]|nr:DHA2 family efflux MFS transporter permease subunit [Candidatus Dactylopiibacterium sp.]